MTHVAFRSQAAKASAREVGECGLSLPSRFATLIHAAFTMEDAHAHLTKLEAKFPDWFQKCDRILSHPLSSERHDLIDAMASAPDFFLKGILYGAYFSSLEIEQVTGRAV